MRLAGSMASASLLTLLITTMAAVLLLAALLCREKILHLKSRQRLPPGPATLPVIGNMHQMLANKPGVFRWIHRLLAEMDTDILCLRLGPVHVITVASPELAREVLRTNDAVLASRAASFAARSFSLGYKGTIMSPAGDQWRKMKRVLTSAILSPEMEHRLLGGRTEEADHLVSYVHNLCRNKPDGTVDVRSIARHFCGNIVRKLLFGKRNFSADSAGGPGHDEEEHVDALFMAVDYLSAFCVSDYFPALVGFDLEGHEEVVRGVMRTFSRLHDPLVDDRVQEWWAQRESSGGKKREVADFLDVLVSLENGEGQPMLTVEEIKAETLDIALATVDNPSNAVEWALAEMVNNPSVMKKAIDEIDSVIGRERLVQECDIGQLSYLKACIREVFRMHPYHAFTPPHVAMADTTIAGYLVPKGSHVILSRIGIGRNAKVWDNPLEFQPERHLRNTTDVVLAEPEMRFVSFGAGRRGCPGVSLGTSITMMLFARLLQGFTWSIPQGVDSIELQESATSLKLSKPLILQAKPRLALHLLDAK